MAPAHRCSPQLPSQTPLALPSSPPGTAGLSCLCSSSPPGGARVLQTGRPGGGRGSTASPMGPGVGAPQGPGRRGTGILGRGRGRGAQKASVLGAAMGADGSMPGLGGTALGLSGDGLLFRPHAPSQFRVLKALIVLGSSQTPGWLAPHHWPDGACAVRGAHLLREGRPVGFSVPAPDLGAIGQRTLWAAQPFGRPGA